MLIPNKLKQGDKVLVVSASNSLLEKDKEYIEKSKKMLENVGLKVEFSKNSYSNATGYGGTVVEKADDINNGFKNSEYKMIFIAKGGGNSNSLFDVLGVNLPILTYMSGGSATIVVFPLFLVVSISFTKK